MKNLIQKDMYCFFQVLKIIKSHVISKHIHILDERILLSYI